MYQSVCKAESQAHSDAATLPSLGAPDVHWEVVDLVDAGYAQQFCVEAESTVSRDAAQERRDQYLTQSQGFAKVANDSDLNPKVVRTVITAYL